jgi:hypothetical protein
VSDAQPGRGPSPLLPLAYLTCAAAAFLAAAAGVPWFAAELAGHYYHPRVLALAHTVTLGCSRSEGCRALATWRSP